MDDLIDFTNDSDVAGQLTDLNKQLQNELFNMNVMDQYALLLQLNTCIWSFIKNHYDENYRI